MDDYDQSIDDRSEDDRPTDESTDEGSTDEDSTDDESLTDKQFEAIASVVSVAAWESFMDMSYFDQIPIDPSTLLPPAPPYPVATMPSSSSTILATHEPQSPTTAVQSRRRRRGADDGEESRPRSNKRRNTTAMANNTGSTAVAEIPDLPGDLLSQIIQYREPERSAHWLRACFEADKDSDITQVTLWNAYKALFTEYSDRYQNPLLVAAEFIKNVSSTFPTATAQIQTINGIQKFIVEGMRPRQFPVDMKGRPYTRCYWKAPNEAKPCEFLSLDMLNMLEHIMTSHIGNARSFDRTGMQIRLLKEKEVSLKETEVFLKEKELLLRENEVSQKEHEITLSSRAIEKLQKDYVNLKMEDLLKAIDLLGNKIKASIFLILEENVRDAWLKSEIVSNTSITTISGA